LDIMHISNQFTLKCPFQGGPTLKILVVVTEGRSGQFG
jgi:hypothetical protein